MSKKKYKETKDFCRIKEKHNWGYYGKSPFKPLL